MPNVAANCATLLTLSGLAVSLDTTRDGAVRDRTRWSYDATTGLCTNKSYACGNSTSVRRAFLARDSSGTAFAMASVRTLFDPAWNMARVTARGFSAPQATVSGKISNAGFLLNVR